MEPEAQATPGPEEIAASGRRQEHALGTPAAPVPATDIEPGMLAPEVRTELRSLSRPQAAQVARHLVAAGRLVDDDPELALRHAREARRLAARIGVVREAVGITAYHAGEWAEALTELRAARRLTGDPSHLPLMADCERALGRPERALRVVQSPEAGHLSSAGQVELRMVEAGARRDLGEFDAALMALRGAGLDRSRLMPWSARLWYAYADTLLAAGRLDEAQDWFLATASVDADDQTDAEDRLVELGVLAPVDEPDEPPAADAEPAASADPEARPELLAEPAAPVPDVAPAASTPSPDAAEREAMPGPLLFQEPAIPETPSIPSPTDNSGL